MGDSKESQFRNRCKEYLNQQSIVDLRGYGRFLNLTAPTRLKKADLIFEIIEVLIGNKKSVRTRKGAPIKNDYFKAEIPFKIEEIKKEIFGQEKTEIDDRQHKEKKSNKNCVQLQFFVDIDSLNKKQKQLLNDFLNSL